MTPICTRPGVRSRVRPVTLIPEWIASWDLGNPGGSMQTIDVNCNMGVDHGPDCPDFHPMKGPMTTQTMQDLIGKEPLHWRGDRLSTKLLMVPSMSFLVATSR